jgi:hypothetical protein
MVDEKAPVTISIVGTGTGTGGGMAPTPSGTVAVTPGDQPNLRINVVPPVVAIAVRFIHMFFVTFASLIGGDALDIIDLGGLQMKALVALSAACGGAVKDLVTVFSRLEGRFPLLSGSI